MNRFFLIVGILVLFGFTARGEVDLNHIGFKNISPEDGLSYNKGTVLLRDSRGFLWIGTEEGLNRYDGNNFKTYYHDPDDETTLRNNSIYFLDEDIHGNIWVGSGAFLDVLDPVNDRIEHVDTLFNGKLQYINDSKWDLHVDKFGNMWFRSSYQGLYKYMPDSDSLVTVFLNPEGFGVSESYYICSFKEDSAGNIWAVDNKGCIREYDNISLELKDSILLPYENDDTYNLFLDSDDNLWVFAIEVYRGVIFYNRTSGEFREYAEESDPLSLSSNLITSVLEDQEKRIWITTDNGGINVLNRERTKVSVVTHQANNPGSIAQNIVKASLADDEGFLWFATLNKGISYYHPRMNRFSFYCFAPDDYSGINDISSFAEDKEGNLWIGTNGGGLVCYDLKKDTYQVFQNDPEDPNSLSHNVVVGLSFDSNDNLWVGTYTGGLNKWDGKKFTRYSHKQGDPSTLSDNRIWDIFEDKNGLLWIATLKGGINVFDPISEQVVQVLNSGPPFYLATSGFSDVASDNNGNLWFASILGLCKFSIHDSGYEWYQHQENNPNSLSDNLLSSVFVDSRGLVWAPSVNGLNIINPDNGRIYRFYEKDGLPADRLFQVREDRNHGMWLSTSGGLCNITVDYSGNDFHFSFLNFTKEDGLASNEFKEIAAIVLSNGDMAFGYSNGFDIFSPEILSNNDIEPNIFFTGLKVLNQEVKAGVIYDGEIILDKEISFASRIVLNPHQNLFTVSFNNLDFLYPERYKYRYQLEGFNDGWITVSGNENSATFTNLDPAVYKFKVQTNNQNGTWNPTTASIEVEIKPAWWETLLFKFGMVLLVALFIWWQYNQVKSQKKYLIEKVSERTSALREAYDQLEERQDEIEQQNAELSVHRHELEKMVEYRTAELEIALKRAEESDQLKSEFLSNLSHEIRTPMNAVIGLTELVQMKKINPDKLDEYIDIIHTNAKSLMIIINDILDLSRIESDDIDIHLTRFDLLQLLDDLALYYKIKVKSQIEFVYTRPSESEPLFLKADKMRLKQIVMNLVDNAFKFTTSGYVKMSCVVKEQKAIISIRDSGIGIDPSQAYKLFVPFTKIENTNQKFYSGAGLGLALCKKLADLMDGEIEMDSELGKGTEFRVIFKILSDT